MRWPLTAMVFRHGNGKIRSHPNITVVEAEAAEVPAGPAVIATGPLTSDAMSDAIQRYFGGQEYMSFSMPLRRL